MASKNLSQLAAATTSSGSDLYYLVQNGVDMSITFANLQTAMGGGGGGANTSLSNLGTTAINADLIPAGSRVLGSSSAPWTTLWVNEILAPGQIDFNLTTGVLTNNSGSGVANFTTNVLTDNSDMASADWQNRVLKAANGSSSVDWANRALSDGSVGPQLTWTSTGIGLPQMTISTVLYINGSGILTSSAVTPTELGYVSGVTSPIQTQLNAITANGTITGNGTAILSSGTIAVSAPAVTSSTVIILTTQSMSGTIGVQYISSRTPGTGFSISSSSGSDGSTVGYVLIEP